MHRLRIIYLILVLFPFGVSSQVPASLAGKWWFAMLEEASLPLNLTFASEDGALRPYFYSPLQSPDPLGLSSWSFEHDTLRYVDKSIGVRLVLVWDSTDTSFTGSFRQGLLRATLHFTPSDGMFRLERPQEPKPPFPYTEREITVEGKDTDVVLAGTLTIPQGTAPRGGWPAVVLVSGSGQQNRDEELLGHKPFAVLADYLTRGGIAVLRYDDRGVGGSKGDYMNATTLDNADDAEAVFDFLCKQKEVNPNRVGIIGHSEGGVIAPIVASRNKKVAFIVLLAGPATTGADILLQQNQRIFELEGLPDSLIKIRLDALRQIFGAIDSIAESEYERTFINIYNAVAADLTSEQRKAAGLRKADAMAMANQMAMPWMQTFLTLDNRTYLRSTKCPILAINGSKDCQVPPLNLEAIKSATKGKAKCRLFEGLNHLMQHCQSGAVNEYMQIEETMAPEVMQCIKEFVDSQKR